MHVLNNRKRGLIERDISPHRAERGLYIARKRGIRDKPDQNEPPNSGRLFLQDRSIPQTRQTRIGDRPPEANRRSLPAAAQLIQRTQPMNRA